MNNTKKINKKLKNDLKVYSFDKLLKENLKNKKFKKEFDALEEEFSIARELIELRIKHDLTQKQLAKIIKTSQSAIARAESGEYKNLSLSFLRKIAAAFGTSLEIHFKKIS